MATGKGKQKKDGRTMVRVIKMVKNEKTNAYGFREKMVNKEEVKNFLDQK